MCADAGEISHFVRNDNESGSLTIVISNEVRNLSGAVVEDHKILANNGML
jgi:hypothetical protein